MRQTPKTSTRLTSILTTGPMEPTVVRPWAAASPVMSTRTAKAAKIPMPPTGRPMATISRRLKRWTPTVTVSPTSMKSSPIPGRETPAARPAPQPLLPWRMPDRIGMCRRASRSYSTAPIQVIRTTTLLLTSGSRPPEHRSPCRMPRRCSRRSRLRMSESTGNP